MAFLPIQRYVNINIIFRIVVSRRMPIFMPSLRTHTATSLAFVSIALASAHINAHAGEYEFLAPPQVNLNRVYRIDKTTGEVIACQYALNDGKTDIEPGAFGVTLCYRSGEGAGRQEPGEYGLVASRHEQESGVWRVDYRNGSVSVCYVYYPKPVPGQASAPEGVVVCTPANK